MSKFYFKFQIEIACGKSGDQDFLRYEIKKNRPPRSMRCCDFHNPTPMDSGQERKNTPNTWLTPFSRKSESVKNSIISKTWAILKSPHGVPHATPWEHHGNTLNPCKFYLLRSCYGDATLVAGLKIQVFDIVGEWIFLKLESRVKEEITLKAGNFF